MYEKGSIQFGIPGNCCNARKDRHGYCTEPSHRYQLCSEDIVGKVHLSPNCRFNMVIGGISEVSTMIRDLQAIYDKLGEVHNTDMIHNEDGSVTFHYDLPSGVKIIIPNVRKDGNTFSYKPIINGYTLEPIGDEVDDDEIEECFDDLDNGHFEREWYR